MTYSWRKGMLVWDWTEVVLSVDSGFLEFWLDDCSFTVGLPEEP